MRSLQHSRRQYQAKILMSFYPTKQLIVNSGLYVFVSTLNMGSVWEIFKESYTSVWQLYRETLHNRCTASSLETGAEGGILSYFLTRFALKKPERAFMVGSTVFLLIPTVYWPICRLQERMELLQSEVTVVDTQKEILNQNTSDAAPGKLDPGKVDLA